MKTTVSIKTEEAQRDWYVVDLDGKTLGRAAARIATVLRGKHKPAFTPNSDVGDFVIVVNAHKVVLTGNKLGKKIYYDHSNYPGGLKETTARKMLEEKPEQLIERAVWGMLPKGPLGRRQFAKLKVYAKADHPHQAQQPRALAL